MNFFESLQADELAIVEQNLETRRFPKGSIIIDQGECEEGAYIIDEGQVRIEFDTGETDTDVVLRYLEPGAVMGEFSLVDDEPRSANAYAHTDVVARWLPTRKFQAICEQHPAVGVSILTAFCRNLADMVRRMTGRIADYASTESPPPFVEEMISRAKAAQEAFEDWPEERVDALLKDVAEAIAGQAEELGAASVEVTGLGVAADKVQKIRFGSLEVYKALAGQTAAGTTCVDEQGKLIEVASPFGVVLGLIPLTNPVSTMIFKALICLKSRNALILSCHRGALPVGNQAGEIIQDVLQKHGAPVDLVQWIKERTSRRLTSMFMQHKDVSFILATGGPSMVHAAYSSGTPAIGVGPGNAPVWICADADLDAAAEAVIQSKSFDNGVICGSENNLVVEVSVREDFIAALEACGAAVLAPDEIERLTAYVIDAEKGRLHRRVVGVSAQSIAEAAGIQRDGVIRLLVVPLNADQVSGPYGKEKLAPVLSLFTVDGEAAGFALCEQILSNEGIGHTAIIHTQDMELAKRFGLEMPASRVLVNSPGSQGCIGLGNGLTPSLTLGCGTWGSTSTTDNVTYENLLNIKRIAQAL
jgi:acyl-CoA reductase-like NAD-dependent aldehyde dehydrogenase